MVRVGYVLKNKYEYGGENNQSFIYSLKLPNNNHKIMLSCKY